MKTRQKEVLLLFGSNYNHTLHRGVADFASAHRWHLTVQPYQIHHPPGNWRGSGILAALGDDPEITDFVTDAKCPKIDLSGSHPEIKIPRLTADNLHIGKLAADHFIGRGFRSYAYCCDRLDPMSFLRREGFFMALKIEELSSRSWEWEAHVKKITKTDWNRKRQWIRKQIEKASKPLAIFCFNDIIASQVVETAIDSGFSVPEEVAVMGVDNDELICNTAAVPLSSVQHDLHTLGYQGAKLLQLLMDGNTSPERPILITPRGVEPRVSTDIIAIHNPRCADALKFIRDNYRTNIGIRDIAAETGCSRRTLETEFRKELGRTLNKELHRVRMNHVKELLISSRLSIAEVAAASGFQSVEYLHRAFKKQEKITPRQFRTRHMLPS
jgi:LacI family transcriptional regulator